MTENLKFLHNLLKICFFKYLSVSGIRHFYNSTASYKYATMSNLHETIPRVVGPNRCQRSGVKYWSMLVLCPLDLFRTKRSIRDIIPAGLLQDCFEQGLKYGIELLVLRIVKT